MKWYFNLTARRQITIAVLIFVLTGLIGYAAMAIVNGVSKISKVTELEKEDSLIKDKIKTLEDCYKEQKDKSIELNTEICKSLGYINSKLDTLQTGFNDFKEKQYKYNKRLSEGNNVLLRSLDDIFNIRRLTSNNN